MKCVVDKMCSQSVELLLVPTLPLTPDPMDVVTRAASVCSEGTAVVVCSCQFLVERVRRQSTELKRVGTVVKLSSAKSCRFVSGPPKFNCPASHCVDRRIKSGRVESAERRQVVLEYPVRAGHCVCGWVWQLWLVE